VRVCILLLVACGRINFDPIGDPTGDGSMTTGDGTMTMGDGSAMIDAPFTACINAAPVTVNVGVLNVDTCSTGMDLIDGCGPTGTQELVFKFTPTVSAAHTIATYTAGTANVITTGDLSAGTCQPGSCFGLRMVGLTAGMTYYYSIEASSGGCTTVDFKITQP
jgi:hypothetical protein